jgi:DNA-binding NarL/FixJ family response regulator
MDINLPGMSGVEAARRIRAAFPSTVVMLMSTRDGAAFERQAAECGAAAYLPKAQLSPEHLAELWAATK